MPGKCWPFSTAIADNLPHADKNLQTTEFVHPRRPPVKEPAQCSQHNTREITSATKYGFSDSESRNWGVQPFWSPGTTQSVRGKTNRKFFESSCFLLKNKVVIWTSFCRMLLSSWLHVTRYIFHLVIKCSCSRGFDWDTSLQIIETILGIN